jgi:hypothetical protein
VKAVYGNKKPLGFKIGTIGSWSDMPTSAEVTYSWVGVHDSMNVDPIIYMDPFGQVFNGSMDVKVRSCFVSVFVLRQLLLADDTIDLLSLAAALVTQRMCAECVCACVHSLPLQQTVMLAIYGFCGLILLCITTCCCLCKCCPVYRWRIARQKRNFTGTRSLVIPVPCLLGVHKAGMLPESA